jgi:CRISPR-associated protein Cas1
MPSVYVTEPGATIHAESRRIIIQREGEVLRWLPLNKLRQLVLVGSIGLTAHARKMLLKNAVDTIFLNSAGAYLGRLVGPQPAYAELRWQQYLALHDPARALALVRELVRAKIVNQRNMLLKRTTPTPATTELRCLARQAAMDASIDVIRGYEGRAAALYFGAFGGLITNDGFSFSTRNRQPPRDPVNILLSLGYTILVARIESLIWQTGLDVALGALHLPQNGKPALALDLAEEFRPIIVDAVVLRCINKRILAPDDFTKVADTVDYLAGNPDEPERPLRFAKQALHKFLEQLDAKFAGPVFYPPFAAKLMYRDVILQQIRRLIRSFQGDDQYFGFTPHL